MSVLTDFIFQFQERILDRYFNKTLPLTITKFDHTDSFDELSDALLLLKPNDNQKTIVFTAQSQLSIDWINDTLPSPDTEYTYSQIFGNKPIFSVTLDDGSSLKEFGEIRTKDIDGQTLLTVQIILGPFPQTGEIIIN